MDQCIVGNMHTGSVRSRFGQRLRAARPDIRPFISSPKWHCSHWNCVELFGEVSKSILALTLTLSHRRKSDKRAFKIVWEKSHSRTTARVESIRRRSKEEDEEEKAKLFQQLTDSTCCKILLLKAGGWTVRLVRVLYAMMYLYVFYTESKSKPVNFMANTK